MPNIIDLGFNTTKLDADKQKVLASLREVQAAAKELENQRFSIGDVKGGVSDYKKAATELKTVQDNLSKATDNYSKSLVTNAKAQKEAAKQAAILHDQQSIPFTTNLNPDGTVIEPKRGKTSGSVVTQDEIAAVEEIAAATAVFTVEQEKLSKANVTVQKTAEQLRAELERDVKIAIEEKLLAQQRSAAAKNQVREENAVKGSLEQRRAALIRLTAAYANLSAEERASPFGQRLAKVTSDVNLQVKQLEKNIGLTGRNVGNYQKDIEAAAKSTKGFGASLGSAFSSVKQLAYILPGLGIAGIFNLAFEAIAKVASALFDSDSALEKHEKEVYRATEAYIKLRDAQKEFVDNLKIDYGTVERGLQNQLAYAKAQNKDRTELLKIEKELAMVRAASAQTKFFGTGGGQQLEDLRKIYETAQKGYEDLITAQTDDSFGATLRDGQRLLTTEELEEATKRKKAQVDLAKDQYDEQKAIVTESINAIRDLNTKEFEYEQHLSEQAIKALHLRYQTQAALLEEQIKQQQNIADSVINADLKIAGNADNIYSTRIAAEEKANKLRIQLIEVNAKDELNKQNLTAEEIKLINTNKNIALRDNELKYSQELKKIITDRNKLEIELQEGLDEQEAARRRTTRTNSPTIDFEADLKKKLDIQKDYSDISLAQIATAKANEEAELSRSYARGEKSKEEYEKGLVSIQKKYAAEALGATIKAAQEQLKLLELYGKGATSQAQQLREAIAEAQAGLAALGTTGVSDLEKLEKAFEKVNQYTQQLGQLIVDAANIGFTRQMNELQAIEDERQKNYDAEIERINNSTLSEQDKAAKITQLNAKRQAQELAFDKKQRELKTRQARAEKAANIANIVTAGALAVVKALPSLGLALAVGALAAAQLAIAIATPVPTYAEGLDKATKDHYGIYGEAGHELVSKPGKKPFIASTATLDMIPKGTSIIPLTGNILNSAMNREMLQKTAAAMVAAPKQETYDKEILSQLYKLNKKKTTFSSRTTAVVDLGWAKYVSDKVRGRAV